MVSLFIQNKSIFCLIDLSQLIKNGVKYEHLLFVFVQGAAVKKTPAYQPKNPQKILTLSVRRILFGALSLSLVSAHAELIISQNQTITPSAQNSLQQPQELVTADLSDDSDTLKEPENWEHTDLDVVTNNQAHVQQDQPVENHEHQELVDQMVASTDTSKEQDQSEQKQKIAHRLGFKNTQAQSQSLSQLSQYYQARPSHTARCQGTWVQPKRQGETGSHLPDGAIFAQADYGYYDADRYAELSGNVIIEQNGQQVIADKLTFDPVTGVSHAIGQVQFSDGVVAQPDGSTKPFGAGIIGIAQELNYSMDGQQALAKDVAFASTAINAHGYAGKLERTSQSQYQMTDVMFSTCPPTERKWHLDAGQIDIDSQSGRAIARNTTLRIHDVPVFYLPYFNFPIDDRRASGFLLPTVGFGTTGHLQVSTPYYLNLAPNYDATITPTVFTNKNPMLTGEFRYLTQHLGSGTLTASYLPSDQQYQHKNRSRLRYDHAWQSKKIDNLSAYAQYQRVSDTDYLTDFDNLGLEARSLNLPRRLGVSYHNQYLNADLRFENFQRLQGNNIDGSPVTDKDRPYARIPQLSVTYQVPKTWLGFSENLQISGIHNSAYFKKSIHDNSEQEKSGGRIYNQITASYPVLYPWGYITPKLSLNHLYVSYDEDSLAGQNLNKQDGSYSIFAPQVSLDAGLFLEKSGSPFGLYDDSLGGYQVLTPRLKYNYTPYKDQSKMPNFETTVAQISYDQLLSDSWFLGYDRIQDLHAITPAINYRYIDSQGRTRFDGSLAEQIFISRPKVGIDDNQVFDGKSSGPAWRASLQPKDDLWIEMAGSLTTDYDINSFGAQIRYQPNEYQLFNVGFIERKEHKATDQQALSAYTASALFPINNRWRLMGQVQYDHKNKRLLDSLVGLDYEDCCYGISVYAHRYRDTLSPADKTNTAVMAQIRLNGITSGGKLSRLLNNRIMGYDSIEQAWKKAY